MIYSCITLAWVSMEEWMQQSTLRLMGSYDCEKEPQSLEMDKIVLFILGKRP
jgi:hypothetical protein